MVLLPPVDLPHADGRLGQEHDVEVVAALGLVLHQQGEFEAWPFRVLAMRQSAG